jgi:hypothetical protein
MLNAGKLILYLFRYYVRSQRFYFRFLKTMSPGKSERNTEELLRSSLSNTARVTFVDYKLKL